MKISAHTSRFQVIDCQPTQVYDQGSVNEHVMPFQTTESLPPSISNNVKGMQPDPDGLMELYILNHPDKTKEAISRSNLTTTPPSASSAGFQENHLPFLLGDVDKIPSPPKTLSSTHRKIPGCLRRSLLACYVGTYHGLRCFCGALGVILEALLGGDSD